MMLPPFWFPVPALCATMLIDVPLVEAAAVPPSTSSVPAGDDVPTPTSPVVPFE
jgi:hypothetical protein